MVSPCYCAVCAVRLQFKIFWQGYIKKIRKFMVSPTGIPTDYNQSVFHRELQKNYGIVPQSPTDLPTDYNPSVFHRELQKNYGIVPQSPTDLPTDYNPSVFHRELQKNYGIVPHSPTSLPTAFPTSNTDGITDGFTHIPKRTHVWHVSVCKNTIGFSDGSKSLAGFSNVFWCVFQLISDGITDGI